MGKAPGPTGVVSEMMKASGGFGSRWMTDLINDIVKEGCISDDWRKNIPVPVYKGKDDPLVCRSYRAIKLLEQPMKVLERVLEKRIRCIRHLKHIGPLGLAFLTSMFKTALNKNIIPHTWMLTNIVPIPKPNNDTDMGTSYRPISLFSVIAKTLQKSILPFKTANTPMQHGYKTQHSTVTALPRSK